MDVMDNSLQEQNYVTILPNGNLEIRVNNITEAKIALKQLKLKKREISLEKKQITLSQKAIRSEYTDATRRQGPMMRGGKGFGSFIRSAQTIQRNSAKIALGNKLAPLEKEKFRYDAILSAIDQGILKIEAYIIQNTN
jgi:hypothetical protein